MKYAFSIAATALALSVSSAFGAGHAMMGVSLAPITGKVVAEIVAGKPSSIKLPLLSLDRFQ